MPVSLLSPVKMSRAVGTEEKHSFTFTWDLDIDINDTTTKVELPLASRFGEVQLRVRVNEAQTMRADFDHPTWKSGCLGGPVTPRATLFFLDKSGEAVEADSAEWDDFAGYPAKDGHSLKWSAGSPKKFNRLARKTEFEGKAHRRFRVTFSFLNVSPAAVVAFAPLPAIPMRVANG